MRVLVAGWFSFEKMGTTAGDLIAQDIVCSWLRETNINYEVAAAKPFAFPGSVLWEKQDPERYTDIVFVCGPFGNGWPVTEMLSHFLKARLSGVNLSLLQSLKEWNPFTFLYERDSSRTSNPDITFCKPNAKVPVVGVILVHKQKEYGDRSHHDKANQAINKLIYSREMAVVKIDTVLEKNEGGLRTSGEVETLISKMDVVITTRLHGTVLALKNGVPVISIDPISGGAKITQQVRTFGWPLLFGVDNLDDKVLEEAFVYCLSNSARVKALDCSQNAVAKIEFLHRHFVADFTSLQKSELLNG